MSNSHGEFLDFYGYSGPAWDASAGRLLARVIGEERGLYRVQVSMLAEVHASVSGRFQFSAVGRESFPAVGDWVSVSFGGTPAGASSSAGPSTAGERAVIHEVCERKTLLQRKEIGVSSGTQILAANVDTVFVTTSLNSDLNLRRLERYLAVVRESGCTPVILLTKADLNENAEREAFRVAREFPDIEVFTVTSEQFEEAQFFKRLLRPSSTSVFIGSSGVGKSTLVNYLVGRDVLATGGIREHDDRGKHTTTSRGLFVSRYGGLVIDTPGMRELQLADHADGVSAQFSDIEELKDMCKFTDCAHVTEPGCAVKDALEDGTLDPARWRNFLKLEAEVRHGLRKRDRAIAKADKERWKKLSRR